MSSARGAAGAVKPKLHNVNSIYAGKNHNAVKAPGTGKHGGLQSLGKTTAVVRRMPPPATLPSLRAESQGQDPNINLVPQGGAGWHKENLLGNGTSAESAPTKPGSSALGASSGAAGAPSSGAHSTDLRPTWAKQPNAAETHAAAAQNANAVTASARDFPSLAAATASVGRQSTVTLTDSLKPQKSGSWRAGGGSALSKNEDDEPTTTIAPAQISGGGGSGYLTATAPSRNVERQLPSRYYDGSAAPLPPPTGTFQVPKVSQSSTPPVPTQQSVDKSDIRSQNQENTRNAPSPVAQKIAPAPATTAPAFPANVAYPPPNYSQPPPNFLPVQAEQNRNSQMPYSGPPALGKTSDGVLAEEGEVRRQPKSGRGDGGHVERIQMSGYEEREAGQNTGSGIRQSPHMIASNDVRATRFPGSGSYDSRDITFEDPLLRAGESEWQSTQYGYMDREAESRRWRDVGGGGQDPQRRTIDGPQYGRSVDEDAGVRENVEREAAIERSRQKRRMANQGSLPSESEGSNPPSAYGSVRLAGSCENESEWDKLSSRDSFFQQRATNDGGAYRQPQRWSSRHDSTGDYEDSRRGAWRRDEIEAAPKAPEYRMLRRPESRDSAEIPQQLSQMIIQDDLPDEEEDELQLTKLSRPAAKVIKRVAPGTASLPPQQPETVNAASDHTASSSPRPPVSSSPSVVMQQRSQAQSRNQERRGTESRMQAQQNQRGRRQESAGEEMSRQTANAQTKNAQSAGRVKRTQEEAISSSPGQPAQPTVVVAPAPPPADNIWEKRAEERESAERERAAQRDAMQQIRMQQHFPAVGEQPTMGGLAGDLNDNENATILSRSNNAAKTDAVSKQRSSNRHRNQNWNESGYGQGDVNDYYGQEEDEETGGLFRGQREFVNSRVSAHHRSSRGMSLSGIRGGRGYGRGGGSSSTKRGGSVPHQRHMNFGDKGERSGQQRRGKRQDHQEQVPVEEEDNFSNMGEFHVEDTYEQAASQGQVNVQNEDSTADRGDKSASGERRGGRQQRSNRQQHRAEQQIYQPRAQQEEYLRSGGRGGRVRGSSRRTGDGRNANNNQNPPERAKRKKELGDVREEENGRENCEAESGTKPSRSEGFRRGGARGSQQLTRHQRSSLSQHGNPSLGVQTGNVGERAGQMKSPVTSEGHEEWETASESSDIAERQGTQRRLQTSSKYSGSRRVTRPSNGPRRENTAGAAPARAGNSSKNGKPASTTSHVAARGAQSHKEESNQVTGSGQQKRDGACRDGLAGLDINNAGVVVIDERPDMEHLRDDLGDGADGDFEEVLSKKSKRLRQQQINEQLEAEERRKMKEKERQEKRKAKMQSKKMDKKSNTSVKEERMTQNGETKPTSGVKTNGIGAHIGTTKSDGASSTVIGANTGQNTLNTTVWNSNIVKEQIIRQNSPPLENHPVIPSPIARPTPKGGVSSSSGAPTAATVKKTVEAWAGPDDEQRQTTSKKVIDGAGNNGSSKKSSVEFATSFNSPSGRAESSQYDFTFDPSLQDESQPLSAESASKGTATGERSESNGLAKVGLDANDDERLKERLDKVKDFWPGQQQFTNSLLGPTAESNGITTLSNDKSPSSSGAASSLAHGPNVAKVRPQPQTSEPSCVAPPLKEPTSSTTSAPSLPPPSPVACIPPGAYLQSLSQVPPPAALPHYSMIFSEPYNPHSTTSPPAQNLFGAGVSVSQAPGTRSRPASFIEQSQLFIHPPPNGTAASSLTWSSGNPQLELLTGISATPTISSQPTPVQRFQLPSQPRSASAFGAPPPMLNGTSKLGHLARPPHPHQIPPPLPPTFVHPPPDFISLQGTTLGAVGSQRVTEVNSQSSTSSGLPRNAIGVLGQLPPPHIPQQLGFPPQSQGTNFSLAGTGSFNQAPPMPAFTAPPPPLRYPPVPTLGNDAAGVVGWNKPAVSQFPVKYANGGGQTMGSLGRPLGRPQQSDRWAVQMGIPPHYTNALVFQSQMTGKDGNDTLPAGIVERFPSQSSVNGRGGNTPEEGARASSVPNVTTSANESIDGSGQQKKVAKV